MFHGKMPAVIQMKKYFETTEFPTDAKLQALLQKQRAPLAAAAMQETLRELTWYLSGPVRFLLAAFPKADKLDQETIQAANIDRVDIMCASDDERYLPVFTDLAGLKKFKPVLREGEIIYLAGKQDLLDFLHANDKVAACVVNPDKDDLLLYRMHLQNMIKVEQER